ncbi:hypothetical protein KIW84_012996 [Lathyrus oleraceus]|uniref:Uncharacterized protein n=1 Tax=Pisum sativum TaxID=3888 RepID=A0A9D5BJ55_PEA|nr:hypothetical protein KIW84_012996 [Pisum sativum]
MTGRRDIPQPDEVLLRESFRVELFHFGWVASFELLTSVTVLSRIFGLDDLLRAARHTRKGKPVEYLVRFWIYGYLFLTRWSSVRGIYQRVPFISDPQVEFEDTCSEDLVVIRSVDVPVMMVMYPPIPFILEPRVGFWFLIRIDIAFMRITARARRIILLHIARPHGYPTGRNKPRMMDPPNADILELKEKMSELINVMQGFALGQKAIAEKVERIESWLRMGKIQGNAPSSGVKKPFGNGQRKKEGESSDVYAQRGHGRDRYHPYTVVVTIPAGNQSLRTLAPVRPDQRPASYDENAKCEFHSGAPGHNVEGLNVIAKDPDRVYAVGEETDSDHELDSWIKPCVPGMEIQNWKAEKIIIVTLREECDHSPDLIDNNPVTPLNDFDNPIYHAEEEGEEACDLSEELARLLKQEEKVIQPHEERVEIVNSSTEEVKNKVKIGAALEVKVKSIMVALLKE